MPMSQILTPRSRLIVFVLLAFMLISLVPFSLAARVARVADTQVQMKDLKFSPATLKVPAGTTVVWTNNDPDSHNVAIASGPELWVSSEQKQGQTSRFTFTRPGKYSYFCEFHPSMKAEIEVTPSANVPPAAPIAARTYPETGKTMRDRFLDYWQKNGGLAQQGFPISEEMQERSETDGKIYTVQYTERAVFEQHLENKPPYDVLL